jgi:hypothetical protein
MHRSMHELTHNTGNAAPSKNHYSITLVGW